MKIVVIDNYDSFTYNLVHYVQKHTNEQVDVYRNDKIDVKNIKAYDKILISPGPGIPDEAGITKTLIETYAASKSILGVCLGLQAIAEVFGGQLKNMERVCHGMASTITIVDNEDSLFQHIPGKFEGGRYHSWLIERETLPSCLKITAINENQEIMALSHEKYNVKGVQFHPESVLTEPGETIIANWIHS